LSVCVYTGKDTKLDSPLITADTNETAATVLKLAELLLKQGLTVWLDNFYDSSSPDKTQKIIHKTDCVGTLKLTQKNIPIKVKNTKLKNLFLSQKGVRKTVTMISAYQS
jgi:hypothetical protein